MIKLLDAATINKIAAGEVVERPFSVVKELVENSIDAGSGKIIVEIRDGGVSFIRVSDNGCGIPADEIEIAFKNHSTSKIDSSSDLSGLNTLGFRGEALASIAAVSQMEVTSMSERQSVGAQLEIYGGEIIKNKEVACNKGTSIVMRNIFYNTPARKKFLKSVAAETGYISDFMNKIAISRPDISFRFINNGSEMLFTSGNGDLKTAIFSVYGIEYAENLINVAYSLDGISVSGFIGKPALSRANRLSEDIFINSRYVRDRIIAKAAEDAYKTYLTIGRFPAFVLNIGANPAKIDVNAHPQKLEVRFSDEQAVYGAVFNAVSDALRSESLIYRAEWTKSSDVSDMPVVAEADTKREADVLYPDAEMKQFYTAKEEQVYVLEKPADFSVPELERSLFNAAASIKAEQTAIPKKRALSDYRIIGQAFRTYWIIEEGSRLFVIDQHAAHERVLFEETKASLSRGNIVCQTLIAPERLPLSEREKGVLVENIDYIRNLGFDIELIESELYLKSLPIMLYTLENAQTVRRLAEMLSDGFVGDVEKDFHNARISVLSTIACKAAVKGNDKLSEQEARALIESLLSLENPFTCPHGRPTIIEITKYELELMFKRT